MVQIIHQFKDSGTDPSAKVVPAKIVARLEEILVEANRRKQAKA